MDEVAELGLDSGQGDVLVGEIRKSRCTAVKVRLRHYKGVPTCDLRVFYKMQGEYVGWTEHGLAFRRELLPGLIDLLQQAQRMSEESAQQSAGNPQQQANTERI